jgi:hypothetical protein
LFLVFSSCLHTSIATASALVGQFQVPATPISGQWLLAPTHATAVTLLFAFCISVLRYLLAHTPPAMITATADVCSTYFGYWHAWSLQPLTCVQLILATGMHGTDIIVLTAKTVTSSAALLLPG